MAPRGTTARSRNARISWVRSFMAGGYHPASAGGQRRRVKRCKRRRARRRSFRLAAPAYAATLSNSGLLSLLDCRDALMLARLVILSGERDLVSGLHGLQIFDGLFHDRGGLLRSRLVL